MARAGTFAVLLISNLGPVDEPKRPQKVSGNPETVYGISNLLPYGPIRTVRN
jgi:hypothetical protein